MALGVKWLLSEAQTTAALRWNWFNAAQPQEKQRDSRGREKVMLSIRQENTKQANTIKRCLVNSIIQID